MKKLYFSLLCSLTLLFNAASAQSTYMQVYNIFQAKCLGCHGSSSPAGMLNLTGSNPAAVYNSLYNTNPVNPTANTKGDKRVFPGEIHRSFLLRKINNGHDSDNGIASNGSEGTLMPPAPQAPLTKYEIELVQQWILHGAPQTGTVVDTALIHRFYTFGGIESFPVAPSPPPPGQGIQLHVGRYFLAPSTEGEFFLKYDPRFTNGLEINRVTVFTPPQNHHFVVYKFFPGEDANYAAGFRPQSDGSHGSADAISGFKPGITDLILPNSTAYQIDPNTILDYNLHMVNNNPDSIVAMDVYVNFYTQTPGTASKYMYNRNFPNFDIAIPHDNQEYTFTDIAVDSNETHYWMLWDLYSHTHRYGTDYDIYLRNEDGSQGEQVYEGWYDPTYTFNRGYYAWGVDATWRHFESPNFLKINPHTGFIHSAKFRNTSGPDTVFFGITSLDEMMVMGFQYFYGDPLPLSTNNIVSDKNYKVEIFPNPMSDFATLAVKCSPGFDSQNLVLSILDLAGKIINQQTIVAGNNLIAKNGLSNGIYFYQLSDRYAHLIANGKLIISE